MLLVVCSNPYQCNQVPRVLAAEVSTAAEDYQSDDEDCIGNIIEERILPNKFLGIVQEGEDGNEGECDQKLHCEHHEHLRERKIYCIRTSFDQCSTS